MVKRSKKKSIPNRKRTRVYGSGKSSSLSSSSSSSTPQPLIIDLTVDEVNTVIDLTKEDSDTESMSSHTSIKSNAHVSPSKNTRRKNRNKTEEDSDTESMSSHSSIKSNAHVLPSKNTLRKNRNTTEADSDTESMSSHSSIKRHAHVSPSKNTRTRNRNTTEEDSDTESMSSHSPGNGISSHSSRYGTSSNNTSITSSSRKSIRIENKKIYEKNIDGLKYPTCSVELLQRLNDDDKNDLKNIYNTEEDEDKLMFYHFNELENHINFGRVLHMSKCCKDNCSKMVQLTKPFCKKHLKENYNVEVKKSTIQDAGYGLFTIEDIKKSDNILFKYEGEELSENEIDAKYGKTDDVFAQYSFRATPVFPTKTIQLQFEAAMKLEDFEKAKNILLNYFSSSETVNIVECYLENDSLKDVMIIDTACNRHFSSFINHSFKPNLSTVHIYNDHKWSIGFKALRDIKRGSELFINYTREPHKSLKVDSSTCVIPRNIDTKLI